MILDKAGVPLKSSFEVSLTPAMCQRAMDRPPSLLSTRLTWCSLCMPLHQIASMTCTAVPCSLVLPRYMQAWFRHSCTSQMTWSEMLTLRYCGLYLHDRSAVSSIPWYEGCSADMSIWLITGIERVLSQDELQFLRVRSAKQEIMVSARMFLLTS